MSILRNPKLLFFTRIGQFIFAIAFLVLVSWCGTHRGYWNSGVTGPIALGVVATLFTFVITGHGIWIYSRKNPFAGHGKVYTYGRLIVEFIMILMWIGTATLMLRPKGQDPFDLITDYPPSVSWDVCTVFTFVEIVSFFISIALVVIEDHTGKVSGVGSTRTQYV